MRYQQGFNLVELIITLAIVAILAKLALPTYTQHLMKVRRIDGQMALIHLAAAMEQYYLVHQSYQGADLGKLHIDPLSPQGFYTLSITAKPKAYTLSATPISNQSQDHCTPLTLTHQNQKGPAHCWP